MCLNELKGMEGRDNNDEWETNKGRSEEKLSRSLRYQIRHSMLNPYTLNLNNAGMELGLLNLLLNLCNLGFLLVLQYILFQPVVREHAMRINSISELHPVLHLGVHVPEFLFGSRDKILGPMGPPT